MNALACIFLLSINNGLYIPPFNWQWPVYSCSPLTHRPVYSYFPWDGLSLLLQLFFLLPLKECVEFHFPTTENYDTMIQIILMHSNQRRNSNFVDSEQKGSPLHTLQPWSMLSLGDIDCKTASFAVWMTVGWMAVVLHSGSHQLHHHRQTKLQHVKCSTPKWKNWS